MPLESNGLGQTVQLPCTDAFHRQRAVRIWANANRTAGGQGQVVLAVPAGEVARLSPDDARGLAAQLVLQARRVDEVLRRMRQSTEGQVLPLPVRRRVTP